MAGAEQAKPGTFTAASYPRLLRAAFGKDAGRVQRRYPLRKYASPALAFATVITDRSWACPTLSGNAALSRNGKVYGYEFAVPDSPNVNGVSARGVPQGSAHATDLPFLFDLGGKNLLRDPAQQHLSQIMIEYWSSFARTGTPAAAGAPRWPRLTGMGGPTLQLRPGRLGTVDVAAEHQCAFWSSLS